jgi:2-methylisocitrate lyase-like PEP mutase family enzyme
LSLKNSTAREFEHLYGQLDFHWKETDVMTDQQGKAHDFRTLHVSGRPLVLFNVWDAGSTKAVERAGAQSIATGSWSVAAANGFDDGQRLSIEFVIENLARIVAATPLPVSIDIESGYGDDPESVGLTIQRTIAAGAIGCNLEDSYPETGKLRDTAEQVERIRHARRAADRAELPYFINARTDVFFQNPPHEHNGTMLEAAVERAHAYSAAGADGFFVPGLSNRELIARLVETVQLPLNIMVGDNTPSLDALARAGVARVSHGPGPYLIAMRALEQAARAVFAPGKVSA